MESGTKCARSCCHQSSPHLAAWMGDESKVFSQLLHECPTRTSCLTLASHLKKHLPHPMLHECLQDARYLADQLYVLTKYLAPTVDDTVRSCLHGPDTWKARDMIQIKAPPPLHPRPWSPQSLVPKGDARPEQHGSSQTCFPQL